jgi:hypothetical protein
LYSKCYRFPSQKSPPLLFGDTNSTKKKGILRSDSGPVLQKEFQVSILVAILEIRSDFGSISK